MDALVRDGYRAHYALRGERLAPPVAEAAALLATVTGQDIEETSDGRFRIFEGTAPDRVISTVDPQARHGHKTAAHGFDGYKAHVAVDPDSEVICAAESARRPPATRWWRPGCSTTWSQARAGSPPERWSTATAPMAPAPTWPGWTTTAHPDGQDGSPDRPWWRFAKDQFRIHLQAQTITCPARVTVPIIPARRGGGRARFGRACSVCPLRDACTTSLRGRVVAVHPHEAELTAARARQRDPAWRPSIGLPGPRSSASSPICCAATTAAGVLASAGWCA